MKKIVIAIPIYKNSLDTFEQYSLDHSLSALAEKRDLIFIGPQIIEQHYYSERYPSIPFLFFDSAFFASAAGYSQLLLSKAFYEKFTDYEFLLVLQTDAIILRDELDYWCAQTFDYIGAPWPAGFDIYLNIGRFAGDNGQQLKVFVGNGGLSLRRVSKCLALLEEFSDVAEVVRHSGFNPHVGFNEDVFFSVLGSISNDFSIPDQITASRFSVEFPPSYYLAFNGNKHPMGGHAWWKFDPEFWRSLLDDMPVIPQKNQ